MKTREILQVALKKIDKQIEELENHNNPTTVDANDVKKEEEKGVKNEN